MSKTPKLRFKEFSGEWKTDTLGDRAYIKGRIGWKNLKQEEYTVEGPYLIAGKHIKNGIIDWDKCDHISMERYEESPEIALQNDDIIFSKDGSLGNPALIENLKFEATINGTMMLVRLDNNIIHPKYFYYILNSIYFEKLISVLKSGSSIPHIFQRDIVSFKFPITKIEEQEKIASFLSLIDKKISLQSEKVEMLKEYKKGMMQKIFSRELRFKDDSRIDYPEWKCMKLEDILTIPEKIKEENISKDKLLTVKLHRKGVHVNENTETLSIGSTVYYKRKAGQIIYGKQNFFNGAIAIIPKKFDGFISSGDVPALDVNNNVADSVYILNFIGRDTFYKRTEALATGTGSKRLHENILLDISIELPCIDEQKKIVDLLNKINEKLEKEQEKLDSLNEYKKGLLQQMFV